MANERTRERVVHVHPTHPFGPDSGGAEAVIGELSAASSAAGVPVTIYSRLLSPLTLDARRTPDTGLPGVNVVETPAASVEWMVQSISELTESGRSHTEAVRETAGRLAGFFQQEFRALGDVAVVHVHNLQDPFVAAMSQGIAQAARREHIPTVFTVHTNGELDPSVPENYDVVVYNSDASRIQYGQQPASREGRSRLIQLGVDTDRFRPDAPADLEVAALPGLKVVVPGRSADPKKGVRQAIEAFRDWQAGHPGVEATLVLCDTMEPAEMVDNHRRVDALKDVSADLPARWIPVPNSRMPGVLAAADLVLIPTQYAEVGPIVALEAMATGRAVVATRLENPPRQRGPFEAGSIVEAMATGEPGYAEPIPSGQELLLRYAYGEHAGGVLVPFRAHRVDDRGVDPVTVAVLAATIGTLTDGPAAAQRRARLGALGRAQAERMTAQQMVHGYGQLYGELAPGIPRLGERTQLRAGAEIAGRGTAAPRATPSAARTASSATNRGATPPSGTGSQLT